MSATDHAQVANRILSAIPPAEFRLLAPDLEPFTLENGAQLYASGEALDFVYFVESGFISVVGVLEDGAPLELGIIGREGAAGFQVAMSVDTSFGDVMTQMPGKALRIPAAALSKAREQAPGLQTQLLRFGHAMFVQVSQTAACNARHELPQRLARWLLSAHDRHQGGQLALTQEFLSMMLGVRRSTVSVAAAMLQKAGMVRYHQGHITILDRSRLEEAACECYSVVVNEYRKLLR